MPVVKACPEECTFDWVQFHKDFDIALAHMIEEADILPSKTNLITFMEFSNQKRILHTPEEVLNAQSN